MSYDPFKRLYLPNQWRMDWLKRINKRNLFLIFWLAFQGGALNVIGFLSAGKFVTHVTGFSTMFGYNLAIRELGTAVGMFFVPLFFCGGAFISAVLIDRPLLRQEFPSIRKAIGMMIGLILLVLILEIRFPSVSYYVKDSSWTFLVANLLALSSGVQNGMSSSIFHQNIRTTHLTGPTTDLGIGASRLLFPAPNRSVFSDFINWVLRFGTILSFILGSVLSAVTYVYFGAVTALLIPLIFSILLLVSTFNKGSPIYKLREPMGILK